jgi:hypothetical protein
MQLVHSKVFAKVQQRFIKYRIIKNAGIYDQGH